MGCTAAGSEKEHEAAAVAVAARNTLHTRFETAAAARISAAAAAAGPHNRTSAAVVPAPDVEAEGPNNFAGDAA